MVHLTSGRRKNWYDCERFKEQLKISFGKLLHSPNAHFELQFGELIGSDLEGGM